MTSLTHLRIILARPVHTPSGYRLRVGEPPGSFYALVDLGKETDQLNHQLYSHVRPGRAGTTLSSEGPRTAPEFLNLLTGATNGLSQFTAGDVLESAA